MGHVHSPTAQSHVAHWPSVTWGVTLAQAFGWKPKSLLLHMHLALGDELVPSVL